MKHLSLLIMLLLLTVVSLPAQDSSLAKNVTLEQLMEEKIRELKNGALLVWLQTKETSISALRKAGNEEQANQVEAKQTAYNKEIIAAFKSDFNFCPVYFFQSHYTENIITGNLEEVVSVNDSLVPDPDIQCTQTGYMTAEFGALDPRHCRLL